MSKPPVFIVGSPRSGTTLMRMILNRHPAFAICGETLFRYFIYNRRRAFGDLADPQNRRRVIEEYLSTKRIARLRMDPAGLRRRLLRDATSYRALFTSLIEYYAESQGKPRWGEKTPQHAFFTDTLFDWYPGAVLIHMLRDPRDTVSSLQRMVWAPRSVMVNARTWLRCNLAARSSGHQAGYLLVRYETLVSQPEQEVGRICKFLDEEYFPSMLAAEEPEQVCRTAAHRSRMPITTGRIGNWREQLTPAQVAQIEWVVGEHMQSFGYKSAEDAASMVTIASGLGVAGFETLRKRIPQIPGILYHVLRPTKLVKEESWIHGSTWREDPKLMRAGGISA